MGAFFGSNRFKFGMFGLNCAGGMTLSSAAERWAADWDEIAAVSKMADDEGIEFLLPIAKAYRTKLHIYEDQLQQVGSNNSIRSSSSSS